MYARISKCFYNFPAVCFFIFAASILLSNCRAQNAANARINNEMPAKILWAWERAEDLRFLDAEKFGVAFLAQTLILQKDDVEFRPRRQPLEVPENIYLIAVTRIETNKQRGARPAFSDRQRTKIVSLVAETLELPDVKAIQIDFDAAVSERGFYKSLIDDLKIRLPENTPFTITALASWCVQSDAWFHDLPIDEAVPMVFQMGAQDKLVRDFLASGNDWREQLCRASYGVSVDEPLDIIFKPNRRVFYFKSGAWAKSDVEKISR